jgi:hypothetical protein
VNAGREYLIRRGVPHGDEVLAGTRTIHAFGRHRADRRGFPFSNLAWTVSSCRLPQFNRISFRVVQAGEAAVGIGLRVNLDLDSCGS